MLPDGSSALLETSLATECLSIPGGRYGVVVLFTRLVILCHGPGCTWSLIDPGHTRMPYAIPPEEVGRRSKFHSPRMRPGRQRRAVAITARHRCQTRDGKTNRGTHPMSWVA
jgi:hypothetical protein